MSSNNILNDILAHASKNKLDQFIREYAQDNETFKTVFLEKFSPKAKSGTTQKKPDEDYVKNIIKAFSDSRISGPRNRYRDYYEDYGFDAKSVSEKLEPLLEKVRFYIRHDNMDEAVHIAQKLIETIPDQWDENFDDEGDVQVIYDEAIDLLQEMMEENKLSKKQKELLFSWYEKTIADKKHKYIGLNTCLEVLEKYFTSDVEGGFDRVLHIIEQRIANSGDYEKERAIIEKIYLLEENNRNAEADKTVANFLYYPEVRKIKLKRLLAANQYEAVIQLLNEGIEIAEKKQAAGTIYTWRGELLSVYERLNNRTKIVQIIRELFVSGREERKYYLALKKNTPKEEWNEMLEWILKNIQDRGYFGINDLKADIYVEHQMWNDLWQLCRKGGISAIEKYETHLRPKYDKEIFTEYHHYVQHQAAITDKEAYTRVANTLIRMKTFEGGAAIVKQLVTQYRQTYKRRPFMMKELDRVKM